MKVIPFPKKFRKPNKPQTLDAQQVERLVAALWDTQKDMELIHRRLNTLTKIVSILSRIIKEQVEQKDGES